MGAARLQVPAFAVIGAVPPRVATSSHCHALAASLEVSPLAPALSISRPAR